MEEKEYIYLTPMPVRIWHWLNALGIVTLCITGLQIRFPDYINIFGTYKTAISLHNTAGIVVSISYALWFLYYLLVAKSLARLYIPNLEDIKSGMIRQGLFYIYFFFVGRPNPHHSTPDSKFNPLQKFGYLVIMMILVPLVVITGYLLMNVDMLRPTIMVIGGIKILVSAHYLIACALCAFLFVHIYLATMGHTLFAHFKPMWIGWEEVEEHHTEDHDHH
jgi:thiosulfate reductase cytochrome b subunit